MAPAREALRNVCAELTLGQRKDKIKHLLRRQSFFAQHSRFVTAGRRASLRAKMQSAQEQLEMVPSG